MNVNLVLLTGLAYASIGAAILCFSHRALYHKATRIVAGYPKVLSALHAHRHDGRFGFLVLLCGVLLQALAACGLSVSLDRWPLPVYGALAAIVLYGLARTIGVRCNGSTGSEASVHRAPKQGYETRRSMILLEAARREAASRSLVELGGSASKHDVIYIGEDAECRCWSERFGVSPDALRAAVRAVGPMATDIERYFSRTVKRARLPAAA
jgi:hypothetical protein